MDLSYYADPVELASPDDSGDAVGVADRPPLTVRDVLRLVLPAGTIVVGGDVGLGHAVTWARLIPRDLSSLEHVESGDLALFSLPVQTETPHAVLASILKVLAGQGIAGLVVLAPVPPGAQALADAIGTPLLAVPPETRLAELEKSIVGLIVNRRAELEQRGVQIYRKLAQQTIENRGIDAIIETLAEITAKTVVVQNVEGALEIYHGPPRARLSREDVAAALREAEPIRDWFAGLTLASTSPPIVRRTLSIPGWARFVAPIVVGSSPVGFLSIVGRDDELDEIDRVAAGRAAAVCALEIAKRQAINEAEKRIRSDFLDDLFAGRFTSEAAMISRGQLLGFDPLQLYAVVLFDLDTSSAYLEWMTTHDDRRSVQLRQAFSRGIAEELAQVNPSALVRINSESAAVLYPVEPEQDRAALLVEIESIRQRIARRVEGMTISAALGHQYPKVLDAPRAYREAEQTLTIALRLFGPNRTTAFDDLGIYRLLFHLHGTPELKSLYEETLGKVAEHDERHDSDLVPTLRAFFATHGNLSKTAETLFLHRNTVSYRLQRIEEITGLRLDDEDDRFRLQLALKLRDFV